MDEWIDILDGHGEMTGRVALKSEAHRAGLWHRCFHCWIAWTDDSGDSHLLAQRRAFDKDTWPGRLDVSVAGHLGAGESPLDGIREIEEEIGLSIEPERLIPLGARRVEHEIPQGLDREFHDVFLLIDSTHPAKLRLQKEEVDAIVSMKLEDARTMADGESVPATEYKGGETSSIRISLPDFVLGSGGYIRDVAGAAERLLGGEKTGRIFAPDTL